MTIDTCTHRVRHQHGTLTGYVSCHCRCPACTHAAATYQARRKHDGRPRRLDPTGTRRRIQALACIGYSPAVVDRMVGLDSHAGDIARGRTGYVLRDTAARIAALYERLSMTPAPTHTLPLRISAAKARRLAVRQGWAPPMAWVDIDNPAEQPTGWQRRDLRQRKAADHAAAVADLRAVGYTPDDAVREVATRHQVTLDTVRTALRRMAVAA